MSIILNHFILDFLFLGSVILAILFQSLNNKLSHYSLLLTFLLIYFLFRKTLLSLKKYIHDIQSPILTLKAITDDGPEINQIVDMTNSLCNKQIETHFTMEQLINEILNMKKREYPTILFKKEILANRTLFHSKEIFIRNISNLINNGIQANANIISIKTIIHNSNLLLIIEDNGDGFDPQRLKKGIGTSSAISFAKSIGGSFDIKSTSMGSVAIITVPQNKAKTIYIDDDSLSRVLWQTTAQKKFVELDCFEDPAHINFSEYNEDTPIYIDSILSNNIIGEKVAFDLYHRGYKNIFLTTGRDKPRCYPWIKKTMDKQPPWETKFRDASNML